MLAERGHARPGSRQRLLHDRPRPPALERPSVGRRPVRRSVPATDRSHGTTRELRVPSSPLLMAL